MAELVPDKKPSEKKPADAAEAALAGGTRHDLKKLARGLSYEQQRKVLTPDGDKKTRKLGGSVTVGEKGQVGAQGELAVENESDLAKRSMRLAAGRSEDGAVTAEASRSERVAQDELVLANSQQVKYADGQLTAAADREQQYRDPESGVLVGHKQRASANALGEDGPAVTAGVSASRALGGHKTEGSVDAAWSEKKGLSGKGALTVARETKDGRKVTRNASLEADKDSFKAKVGDDVTREGPGGEKQQTARSLEAAYGDKGFEGKAAGSHVVVVQDGTQTATETNKGSLGYSEGALKAEGTLGREVVDKATGTSDSRSVSGNLTATDKKVEGGGRFEARRKDEVGERGGAVDVKVNSNGDIEAALGTERIVGDKGGDHLRRAHGASFKGGTLNLNTEDSASHRDGDATHQQQSKTTVAIGADSVALGRSGGSSTTTANGTVATTHGGSIDVLNGEASGHVGVTSKDPDGQTRSAINGSGRIKVGPGGRIENASANVSGSIGSFKAGLGAGIGWTFGEPRKVVGPGGREEWMVECTRNSHVGGDVGMKGVGIGGKRAEQMTRTIRVRSKRELDQLLAKGPTPEQMKAVTTGAGAAAMAVGEVSASQNDSSADLKGEADLGVMSVGATFSVGSSKRMEVTKVEGGRVKVRVQETSKQNIGGTLGASVGTLGASSTDEASKQIELEFQIDSPLGKQAFDEFQRTGVVPKRGCRLLTRAEGTKRGASTTVGVAGASYGDSSTVENKVSETGDGDRVETSKGTRAQNVSVPLLGKYNRSVSLEGRQVNEGAQEISGQIAVGGDSSRDVANGLADATGMRAAEVHQEVKGSRQWAITAHFPDTQIRALVAKIQNGEFVSIAAVRYRSDVQKMLAEVRSAGADFDRVRNALSAYIASTGADGFRTIRQTLGMGPGYEVEVPGDKYWRGPALRAEIEKQTADFRARAASPPARAALLGDLDAAIKYHRERAEKVASTALYPEVPPQLRDSEVDRSRRALKEFEAIRQKITNELRAAQPAKPKAATSGAEAFKPKEQASPAAAFFGGAGAQTSSQATPAKQAAPEAPQMSMVESAADKAVRVAWEQAQGFKMSMPSIGSSAAVVLDLARNRHWFHWTGGNDGKVPVRELGFENLFGNGRHADDYKAIDGAMRLALRRNQECDELKAFSQSIYDGLERKVLTGKPLQIAEIQQYIYAAKNLQARYRAVTSSAGTVLSRLQAIEQQNPTLRNWSASQAKKAPDYYLK